MSLDTIKQTGWIGMITFHVGGYPVAHYAVELDLNQEMSFLFDGKVVAWTDEVHSYTVHKDRMEYTTEVDGKIYHHTITAESLGCHYDS